MTIKLAIHYLKNNKIKLLPLYFCVTVLSCLMLLTIFTRSACLYLSAEVKKDIRYEAHLEGRMCSANNFNMYFEAGENIEEEYQIVKSFLINNNACFHPMLETVVPLQFFCITKDIDSFMERYDSKNDAGNICLYGVNENYFDENKIKISEGRNFQPYEKGKIIINENSYQIIDGEPIPIEIGDIISLPVGIISDRRPEYFEPEVFLEYEVIGKYRERKTDILSSDKKDYKLNHRYYISEEDAIFHMETFFERYRIHGKKPSIQFDPRVNLYLPKFAFNDVCFYYENESDLAEGINKISSFVKEMNDQINQIQRENNGVQEDHLNSGNGEKPNYSFGSSLDLVSGLLTPLEMTQKDIESFMIIDCFVSALILLFFFGFQFRNRRKEFAIKEAMGLKESDLVIEILIENFIVSAMAFFSGFIIYRLSGKIIFNNVFKDSIAIQNSLIRIISGKIDALAEFKSIQINYQMLNNEWAVYLVVYLASTGMIILISYGLFKRLKPKNLHRTLTSF